MRESKWKNTSLRDKLKSQRANCHNFPEKKKEATNLIRKTPPSPSRKPLFESLGNKNDTIWTHPVNCCRQLHKMLGSLNKYCNMIQNVSAATTTLHERMVRG